MQVRIAAFPETGIPKTLIIERKGKYDLILTLEGEEPIRVEGVELWRSVIALMADEKAHKLSEAFVCL